MMQTERYTSMFEQVLADEWNNLQPTTGYVTKHIIDWSRSDQETACAEILLSLSGFVSESNSPYSSEESSPSSSDTESPMTRRSSGYTMRELKSQLKAIKKDKSKKMDKDSRFKRNVNACADHRRKHQKCPMDCLRRKQNEQRAMMEEL
eukprot:TRINITY_DN5213_c0_g1_i1.p1 TRINITY_DN5213_c0_g1~~TRINITY_DN5213_c0_g1_i1.p1  ORF type:complete len:149 (+),score=31.20 TRINITY_DN5213_c0_g1_i1:116-562(+)